MRHSGLMVLALAASCVAVDAAEDADFSETEQAEWNGSNWDSEGETIHVQGGLDPCWAGLCWPSSWPTDPGPGYTGEGGGGGGGGHGGGAQGNDTADPRPLPAPRDCTQEVGHEECYACCDWNVDNVWGGSLPPDSETREGRAGSVLEGGRTAPGRLPTDMSPWPYHHTPDGCYRGAAMTWLAELPLTWVIDGKRVPGLIAIGMPELVPDDSGDEGEGEAICTIALDGLQPRTRVHGEGKLSALLTGVHFLDARIRDHVSKGVRAVFPGDVEDPERATASLLAMFKPFE